MTNRPPVPPDEEHATLVVEKARPVQLAAIDAMGTGLRDSDHDRVLSGARAAQVLLRTLRRAEQAARRPESQAKLTAFVEAVKAGRFGDAASMYAEVQPGLRRAMIEAAEGVRELMAMGDAADSRPFIVLEAEVVGELPPGDGDK